MIERKVKICIVCKEKEFMEVSKDICKSCIKKQRDKNNKNLSI